MRDAYSMIIHKNYRNIPNIFKDDLGWRGPGGIVVNESRTMKQIEEALKINKEEIERARKKKIEIMNRNFPMWEHTPGWAQKQFERYEAALAEARAKRATTQKICERQKKRRKKVLYIDHDTRIINRVLVRKEMVIFKDPEPLAEGWRRHQRRNGEEYFTYER